MAHHEVTVGMATAQRRLPELDGTIEELGATDRGELAQHWLSRSASERRVADSFVVIHRTLSEHQAPDALVRLAARAVEDEYRHAELARQVASRFQGADLPSPPLLQLKVPEHQGASPALKRTLFIVGQCALNETFASAVLEASLEAATGPLAKEALRELLADEIDHARIGWAHLATLDAPGRAEFQPWLIPLVRDNLQMWRSTPRDYPTNPALVSQGALTTELLEGALQAATRELVVPGLQHLGISTDALARWLEQTQP